MEKMEKKHRKKFTRGSVRPRSNCVLRSDVLLLYLPLVLQRKGDRRLVRIDISVRHTGKHQA